MGAQGGCNVKNGCGAVGTVVRCGGYGGTVRWVRWYGAVGAVCAMRIVRLVWLTQRVCVQSKKGDVIVRCKGIAASAM